MSRREEINQQLASHSRSSVQSSPRHPLLSLHSVLGGSVSAPPLNRALVLDGLTIEHILPHKAMRATLLEIAKHCRSVLCCRVTPLQKACMGCVVMCGAFVWVWLCVYGCVVMCVWRCGSVCACVWCVVMYVWRCGSVCACVWVCGYVCTEF